MGEAIDTLLINNVCCNAQRLCLVYRVYDEQCQKIPSFATELSTFTNVTGESCESSWVCTATAKQALRINASRSLFLLLRAAPMW
jgi:hypothetical protein